MSLKHNIVFIILGLFLFKIGILDQARNYHHHSAERNVASTHSYGKGIR